MKRALLALALALLAGCGARVPDTAHGLRDSKALIGATSRYDAERFKGPWLVRDSFGDGVAQVALVETTQGPAFQLCSQIGCGDGGTLWLAQQQGQGRYALSRPDGSTRTLWVLWVDEGFRTAVVGNPAGDFGWILDRSASGGADRIAAAREILDFNGYDTDQLRIRQ
ncbi:lipocalin family protein [uncultured Sulfitobacter sp.]|jgi:apolipoprotein D and lipocalin family protein|uniref:lipocalin family protein n=1 Tax=uncultured Sulfitobacter sp. TaxID=191468 RepID=UPI002598950A|nr:lipocalin family protein [uncultured Sulfitobacter sp.]